MIALFILNDNTFLTFPQKGFPIMINRDFISRYRTLPAASCDEDLPASVYPWLPASGGESGLAVICPLHNHPEAEILLVRRGTWYYRTGADMRFCAAGPGDLVFFSPYELHESAMQNTPDGVSTLCICFDPVLLSHPMSGELRTAAEGLSDQTLRIDRRIPADAPDNPALRASFLSMQQALDDPEHCRETAFLGSLYTMFGLLWENSRLHDEKQQNEAVAEWEQQFIRDVVAYTDQHYTEELHTAVLAQLLNYNEAYFCRTFRRLFQMRFSEYVNFLRISRAKVFLKTKSVTETAIACGYSNLSYFSSVFRKHTGMTPAYYRQLHAKDAKSL